MPPPSGTNLVAGLCLTQNVDYQLVDKRCAVHSDSTSASTLRWFTDLASVLHEDVSSCSCYTNLTITRQRVEKFVRFALEVQSNFPFVMHSVLKHDE